MNNNDLDEFKAELDKARRENFKVEIETIEFSHAKEFKEFYLRTTHNGYQWSAITLSPEEGLIVAKALINHCVSNGNS